MSTRAAYFFKDEHDHHMVYKHHDGYPSGAERWLSVARRLSWQRGRFEADEAAAAFVCSAKLAGVLEVDPETYVVSINPESTINYGFGKDKKVDLSMAGGGTRLMHKSEDPSNIFAACLQCCDIEYAYVIEGKRDDWHVTAYHAGIPYTTPEQVVPTKKHMKKLWSGPLSKMGKWVKSQED